MIGSSIRRNIFEPLYYKKNNSPLLSYWRTLEKTQYLSLQELKDLQWRRFQKLYSYTWEKNKFYRDIFSEYQLSPESMNNPDDIKKLPILTKKIIQTNSDKLISNDFKKLSLLHFKTGGSTGKALDIFMDENCSSLRNACTRRHDRWTGWQPGEPIAAVWGNVKLPSTLKERLKNIFISPHIYLDTMAVNETSVDKFRRNWKREKPTLLFGHAHSLFILAKVLENMGCDEIRPKGILSTSMMLIPPERKTIESVFRCRVTDRYGCEELGLIACECEFHDGLHLNIEHLIIECINENGNDAEDGESGKLVITDLMNFAMPLIRYSVEDIGMLSNRVCGCGRGLPLMEKVIGRSADFLMKHDGTRVAGISLIENTLTKISGIEQMQIIQNSVDDLTINIVADSNFNSIKFLLGEYFEKLFVGSNINVIRVEKILPEKSGKYRFSICNLE